MSKSFCKSVAAMAIIVACFVICGLFSGCTESLPKPMLTQESVKKMMATQVNLEDALSICIIVAVPAPTSLNNPTSIKEVEEALERSKKEIKFLKGIKAAKTGEEVKALANLFLQMPTLELSDDLRDKLDLYVEQVDGDIQASLWEEMVPFVNTLQVKGYLSTFKNQITSM